MTQLIKSFSDLGIKPPESKNFVGEKISMKKLIGKEIILHDYKTNPSKYEGVRLDLQITFGNEKRVAWTSSSYLLETVKQIPKDALPLSATIMEVQDRFVLT
jgi:hypothetical protein